jgi:peroxiredoxin
VIGRDGKVAYVYSDRNPDKHVEHTLKAVKALTKK